MKVHRIFDWPQGLAMDASYYPAYWYVTTVSFESPEVPWTLTII